MVRIARILFGYRDDLNLSAKWWHRLSVVAFALVTLCVIAVAMLASLTLPERKKGDYVIVTTLLQYMKEHPTEANAITGFIQLGPVATVHADGSLGNESIHQYKFFCSWDLSAHPKEIAEFLRFADYQNSRDVTTEQVQEMFKKYDKIEPASCVDPTNELPPKDSIVVFAFTRTGKAKAWAATAAKAAPFVFGYLFVALNVYYRGFVYIICGPRKKAEPAAT